MKENLPQLKKTSIFEKIKNYFKSIFKNKNESSEGYVKTELSKTDFKDNIQVNGKENILFLQRKLKEKQIKISELADEELDEMIHLYEKQIEDKKEKLKRYRKLIKNV